MSTTKFSSRERERLWTQFNDGNGTQTGTLCRAWVNYKGTATRAINASFNVSSVTFNSTGNYTVNFTTAMPDANYATTTTTSDDAVAPAFVNLSGTTGSASVNSVRIQVASYLAAAVDKATVNISIFR